MRIKVFDRHDDVMHNVAYCISCNVRVGDDGVRHYDIMSNDATVTLTRDEMFKVAHMLSHDDLISIAETRT